MSDDDADDFIAFGKALKPLEDDAIIRKKPIAVEEQIGILLFVSVFSRIITENSLLLQFVMRMASGDFMEPSLVVGLLAISTPSTPPKAGPPPSSSPPGRTKGSGVGRGLKTLWMRRIAVLLGLPQRL